MALLLLALLGDVAPGHTSGVSILGVLLLIVFGIAVVLILLGIVFAVRRRRRHRQ
jgi:hypothetical protein